MQSTWASGAIELLRHADSHIDLKTAFDKRIAFISIDNSVETMIRTYLSLPKSKSGIKITRQELEDAGNSFPKLLALLAKHASNRLIGIDEADIEHYHRIRNTLYHEGTGLSVDDQYIMAYRGIAGVLLENLFGTKAAPPAPGHDTLERLIVNWNNIERVIRGRMEEAGVSISHRWEEAFRASLADKADAEILTKLRLARNRLVHSKSIDKKELSHWVEESERLLQKLSDATEATLPATVTISYNKKRITSELHRYSLVAYVTLNRTPDQDFFRLTILWPLFVGMRSQGFELGEEKKLNGTRYIELFIFVEERLWPGQTMKVIGGKGTAELEYSVDDATFTKLHDKPVDVHYTLYLQDWHPVVGSISFKDLNEF
jgi:hypothetical protein